MMNEQVVVLAMGIGAVVSIVLTGFVFIGHEILSKYAEKSERAQLEIEIFEETFGFDDAASRRVSERARDFRRDDWIW